jgi:drug/metabolite transporter (DMT)-like permease
VKLFVRSCFGSVGALMHFYALKHMPQADVSMLCAGSPAVTTILAWIILKEKIIALDIANVFLVFVGMVLIIQPPFMFGYSVAYETDPEYSYAVAAVSLLTVFRANVYILLRMLKDVHFASILFVFGLTGTFVSTAALFLLGSPSIPSGGRDRVLLIANGVLRDDWTNLSTFQLFIFLLEMFVRLKIFFYLNNG